MDSDAFLLDHSKAPASLKKGPWTAAEDAILIAYVQKHGEGNWNAVQKHSGLSRCGKSCRLRWANHLRPNLKKCAFSPEEERLIIELHQKLGNKWARMAAQLPGRTDNEIKNYWNTRIKRRMRAGLPIYPERNDAVQSSSSSLQCLSSNPTCTRGTKNVRDDKTSSSSSSNNGGSSGLNLPQNCIKAQEPCLPQFRLPQLLPELPSSQSLESASNRLLSEADSYGRSNTNNFLLETLLQDQQKQQLFLLSNHSLGINSTEMNHWIKPTSFSCSNQLASHSPEVSAFSGETQHEWNLMAPTLKGNCMKLESNSFTELPIAVNYTDEELSTLLDFAKPDPASLPEWYNHNLIVAEAPNQFSDLQDAASELEQLLSEQAAMNQAWEQFGSCKWNNMPGVCQTSETYSDSCAIY